jgi:hypothetical protein
MCGPAAGACARRPVGTCADRHSRWDCGHSVLRLCDADRRKAIGLRTPGKPGQASDSGYWTMLTSVPNISSAVVIVRELAW